MIEDEDAHVEAHDRFFHSVTVAIALRISDLARADCERKEHRLSLVRIRAESNAELQIEVVRATIEAAQALERMMQTTSLLESAVRLAAMGRT